MLNRLRALVASDGRRLGAWALTAITEDTIEAFFASLVDRSVSTRNKYVQLLKAMFRWAAKKGYLARSLITESEVLRRAKGSAATSAHHA